MVCFYSMAIRRFQKTTTMGLPLLLLFVLHCTNITTPLQHISRQQLKEKTHSLTPTSSLPQDEDGCELTISDFNSSAPCTQPPVTLQCVCPRETNSCYTIIRWKHDEHRNLPIRSYLLTLFEDQDADIARCYRLPPSQNVYNFSVDVEFPGTEFREQHTIDLFALPKNFKCATDFHYARCPKTIRITKHLEFDQEVCLNEQVVFTCEYEAYPEPDNSDVVWIFYPRVSDRKKKTFNSSKRVAKYDNNIQVNKSRGATSLVIKRITAEHEGSYFCHINSRINHYYSAKSEGKIRLKKLNNGTSNCDQVEKKEKNDTMVVICVAAGVLVVAGVGLTWYFIRQMRKKVPSTYPYQKHTAYISHCATTPEQKGKLLKFSYWLESQLPGLKVVIDLTKETEINKVGGLSQWIPQQLSKVDKVIVLLSQEYLDALNCSKDDVKYDTMTSQTLKVMSEYRYIEQMLHENLQISNKLIICWQSGHPGHLPPIFQGRSYYLLPKFTKRSVLKDNAFLNILSAVSVNPKVTSAPPATDLYRTH